MSTPLKILFATPECAPWVKTGGLGDVSAALPRALTRLGHDVVVLMPAYRSLKALVDSGLEVGHVAPYGDWPWARLVQAGDPVTAEAGFKLLLLDCPALYDQAGGPYQDVGGQDFGNNAVRFGLLSWVAALLGSAATPLAPWRADLVHAHDWPAALAPVYLRGLPGAAPSVMTIHNLAFQGVFPLNTAPALRLPLQALTMDGLEYWGQLSFLKGGLLYADAITTVSPTYALEIQDEPLGFGLQGVLHARASHLTGILNGIDTSQWNPRTDPHIAVPYGADTLAEGKRANKAALQVRCGLAADAQAPLFGVVSRLTSQKGIDLIADNADWLVAQGAQLVVLGQGEPALEGRLRDLAARHPGRVAVTIGFEEALAHGIEAGADCFLMPSRFEPCGLNQMYSLAYGTPPVVRATGGLADSVRDERDHPGQATGFTFHAPDAEALREALSRVLAVFGDPPRWHALRQRGMAQPFDWAASAGQYDALYRQVIRGESGLAHAQPSPLAPAAAIAAATAATSTPDGMRLP